MLLTIELEGKRTKYPCFCSFDLSQARPISSPTFLKPELPQTLYSERLVSDLAEELEADETDFRLVVVVAEVFHGGFEGV